MTSTIERTNQTEKDSVAKKEPLKIGIPKEIYENECRVAATPETAQKLQKLGFEILVETGAGECANFSDNLYKNAQCQIISDTETLWNQADIILKVRAPQMHPTLGKHEADFLNENKTLISFIWPAQNQELLDRLAAQKTTVVAMDSVPRISRAQKMDALSSMANIGGYRAVIEAAHHFGRFFTGQITAAGKMPPAKVLIIGAGVAGLAAIGAAKSLGAIVRAFDTRPVVKEQVQSLGGEFLELHFEEDGSGQGGYAKTMSKEFIAAEMALFAQQAKDVDIIITTALIPGKKAPLLVTEEMVASMKEGSVIVDMAAEQGGNCEVTKPGEIYNYKGVTIIGVTDLPSRLPSQASQLYGTNIYHLLKDMGGSDNYQVDLEDEVIRSAVVINSGEIIWPAPKPSTPSPQTKPATEEKAVIKQAFDPTLQYKLNFIYLLVSCVALVAAGIYVPSTFLSHVTVFVLSCFLGWQLIWNVAPALHTPLMSVTNAISGIVILGGMLQISDDFTSPKTILGAIAIMFAMINIAGGFMVTQRMLNKFRK